MTYSEALKKFGLPASSADGNEIRQLLAEEIERARSFQEGDEMLRTLCVQLFSLGIVDDSLIIWGAKQSNFDAGCGIDIQLLCGAGLPATKAFLKASCIPAAADALSYLSESEESGDFADFSPVSLIAEHRRYYHLEA